MLVVRRRGSAVKVGRLVNPPAPWRSSAFLAWLLILLACPAFCALEELATGCASVVSWLKRPTVVMLAD
jgi:hypothetical protein